MDIKKTFSPQTVQQIGKALSPLLTWNRTTYILLWVLLLVTFVFVFVTFILFVITIVRLQPLESIFQSD